MPGMLLRQAPIKPDSPAFAQGRPPEAVHIIERGVVDLVHEDGAGAASRWPRRTDPRSVVVQTARRGVAVGDLPAMLGLPHAYSGEPMTVR